MTRPVYERCLNPACQREQACQSEAFCIADAEKDIWNEAIEAAIEEALNYESCCGGDVAEAIRALKRQ